MRQVAKRIGMIAILVLCAIFLPGRLLSYVDYNIRKQTSDFSVTVKTYSNRYTGFDEILQVMAQDTSWTDLSVVAITDQKTLISDKELTEAVNQEFETIVGYQEFAVSDKIIVTTTDLKSRQLVSLYSENTSNPLNGVQLWKLDYETDDYDISLVMEADFQKICEIKVESNQTAAMLQEDMEYYSAASSSVYVDKSDFSFGKAVYQYYDAYNQTGMTYMNILPYVLSEMESIQKEASANDMSLGNVTGYEETNTLFAFYQYELNVDKSTYFQFGIWQIHQLIQL